MKTVPFNKIKKIRNYPCLKKRTNIGHCGAPTGCGSYTSKCLSHCPDVHHFLITLACLAAISFPLGTMTPSWIWALCLTCSRCRIDVQLIFELFFFRPNMKVCFYEELSDVLRYWEPKSFWNFLAKIIDKVLACFSETKCSIIVFVLILTFACCWLKPDCGTGSKIPGLARIFPFAPHSSLSPTVKITGF